MSANDDRASLDKTFDPAALEAKWYAHWEDNGLFRPHRPDAEPFTLVNPPPNVTGSLHIGHALDNTLQDVVIRYERLRGKDALWVVGTDHAGIATQMVVERQLEAAQDKRTNYSRKAFVEKVWEWKAESGGTITRQLRRLGCSMDWSREQFTMSPEFTRAVTKVFVDLYNQGLIYRDKRLVNWDPKLKTAISDLEVETQEIKGSFWRFRYPLADGVKLDADGPLGGADHIVVATTRPETMLADMAVAVNGDDPRYKSVIGKFIAQPITGRRLLIVADEHADPELGSGAVKITPGHDFNDFEVGKRAGIEPRDMLNMFDAEALVVQCSDGLIPEKYLGLDRFVVRDMIVADLKSAGCLVPHMVKTKDGEEVELDAEPRTIQTPYGDRGGVVIEPWLTDQWYVDAATLAQPPIQAVRDGRIEIVPKSWEKTWFNWMENIQPWCVSRQLWWGHRIPAWYGVEFEVTKNRATSVGMKAFVAETEEEAVVQAHAYVETLNASGNPMFASARVDVEADEANQEPSLVSADTWTYTLWRDNDVLDTWFSSALWPFATLGWPDASQGTVPSGEAAPGTVPGGSGGDGGWGTVPSGEAAPGTVPGGSGGDGGWGTVPKRGQSPGSQGTVPEAGGAREEGTVPKRGQSLVERHYPNDLLISGFDILFFWDARMAMQGLHFMKDVPWRRLYLHGLVRAADGQKMSKSKGNVVDPLLLIDKYGADALRFFMAAMESQGRDVKMDEKRVEGYRNFATKLWNAARFCQANLIAASQSIEAPQATLAVNKWIIGEVVETLAELDKAMADLRFDAAANAIYHFVWDTFCDWYIELIKGSFDDETRAVAGWVLDQILVMLHPFMPFVTEELWSKLGERANYPLITASWPAPGASVDAEAKREVEWLIALVGNLRTARSELGIAPGAKLEAFLPGPSASTRATIEANPGAIDRLARLSAIRFEPAPIGAAMQIGAGDANLIIPLEGVIDIAAEKARLAKALELSAKEANALAARLANPAFVEKAKPEAVDKAHADYAMHAAEAERLRAALARLG